MDFPIDISRTSEEKHRLISENTSDLIAVLDCSATMTYVSPSLKIILGLTPVECIGKSVFNAVHPEDMATVLQVFNEMVNTKTSRQVAFRCSHRAGHWVVLEGRGKPVVNDEGVLDSIVLICRDITERVENEKKLADSESRFKSLFEHNTDAIFSIDLEGRFLSINPATEMMTGYSSEELMNRPFLQFIALKDREYTIEHFIKSIQGVPQNIRVSIFHKDGRLVEVDCKSVPIMVNNQIVGVYGIAKDITELKRTEELLRKSEKLSVVGQLAAGVAHEIRNPLTSLKGFLQLIQENGCNPEYFAIMFGELERINSIVDDFLVLAKPQAVDFQVRDIRILLDKVVTLLNTKAIIENVQIITHYRTEAATVNCQENQLMQVFINLLKNSIEAMSAGGEIDIVVECKDEENLVIRFIDQGQGIPPERVSRLGEPFYTTKEKGTGLGLMVSYKIIEAHCGNIEVHSEVGKGTTVDVILPLTNKNP